MPETPRLSKRFYDQFGDESAGELVELINQMHAESQATLREISDQNRAILEARMAQQFAEQETKIERRFADQEVKIERRFAATDVKLGNAVSELKSEIHRNTLSTQRWMFGLWVTQMLAIVGLWMTRR